MASLCTIDHKGRSKKTQWKFRFTNGNTVSFSTSLPLARLAEGLEQRAIGGISFGEDGTSYVIHLGNVFQSFFPSVCLSEMHLRCEHSNDGISFEIPFSTEDRQVWITYIRGLRPPETPQQRLKHLLRELIETIEAPTEKQRKLIDSTRKALEVIENNY